MVALGMRKLLLVVVVLLVVVGGAVAVADLVFVRKSVERHAVAAGPLRAIAVTSSSGDIELAPAGARVEVRQTQHYVLTKPKLQQTVAGGVLMLSSDCATPILTCYADLRVTVPSGVAVTAHTDSGDVDATAIAARDARLRSNSGDVRLELVGSQQGASAQTGSGDVAVSAEGASAIEARSDSGDVTVDTATPPHRVVARTNSGDVTITVPPGEYAVDAKTDSGHVKVDGITLNDRAPNSIEARTDSGDVTVRAG
jgi:putative adhesin